MGRQAQAGNRGHQDLDIGTQTSQALIVTLPYSLSVRIPFELPSSEWNGQVGSSGRQEERFP